MRVEGIMATEHNYNLLVETLQDNYDNYYAHCVALVTMVTLYEVSCHTGSSHSQVWRLYVPILLEQLPEKLLINVLKEYTCANPTIDQLIEMVHNEVKRFEQVEYISNNNQPCKPKPPPPPKSSTSCKASITQSSSYQWSLL